MSLKNLFLNTSLLIPALQALNNVNKALDKGDKHALVEAMKSKHLGLRNISDDKADFYFEHMLDEKQKKQVGAALYNTGCCKK